MPSDDTRDEEVMAQVARGQSQLLERLIRRYATPLLTFIRRMVGDPHRSEELFQDVFLAVWSKRQQYQFPRSFKNWLYTIALNRCRQDFRTRPMTTSSSSSTRTPPGSTLCSTNTIPNVIRPDHTSVATTAVS